MSGWISVKDRLPPTPFRVEAWDDDAKVERVYHQSRVHPVLWWGRKEHWVLKRGVYSQGWCDGWHGSDLGIVEPQYWLDYPKYPDHPVQRSKPKGR